MNSFRNLLFAISIVFVLAGCQKLISSKPSPPKNTPTLLNPNKDDDTTKIGHYIDMVNLRISSIEIPPHSTKDAELLWKLK